MRSYRLIPCLDIKDGRVVKGVNFVGLRDAGDPVELARYYYEEGADELVFLDITASHESRPSVIALADLEALATLEASGRALHGAIVGKALYEGKFTVEEAIAACGR